MTRRPARLARPATLPAAVDTTSDISGSDEP
jgi:hypothetical protein